MIFHSRKKNKMNIYRLIKLEIMKYKDNTLVKVLLAFFVFLMPTSIFVMKNWKNIPFLPGKDSIFTFPHIWEYQAYAGSWLAFLFLGFLGTYLITSEIQFKTMRQNIIAGMTRKEFFTAKMLVALLISILATLVFFISTAAIGLYHQETFDLGAVFKGQQYVVLRFFLLTFAYIISGMMVGFLIRRSGLAIFTYYSYVLFIEPLTRYWIHIKIFGISNAIKYYPMNAIEDLAPLPFYKYVENFKPIKELPDILLSYKDATIVSLITVSVFILVSYLSFTRRDL